MTMFQDIGTIVLIGFFFIAVFDTIRRVIGIPLPNVRGLSSSIVGRTILILVVSAGMGFALEMGTRAYTGEEESDGLAVRVLINPNGPSQRTIEIIRVIHTKEASLGAMDPESVAVAPADDATPTEEPVSP